MSSRYPLVSKLVVFHDDAHGSFHPVWTGSPSRERRRTNVARTVHVAGEVVDGPVNTRRVEMAVAVEKSQLGCKFWLVGMSKRIQIRKRRKEAAGDLEGVLVWVMTEEGWERRGDGDGGHHASGHVLAVHAWGYQGGYWKAKFGLFLQERLRFPSWTVFVIRMLFHVESSEIKDNNKLFSKNRFKNDKTHSKIYLVYYQE
jgi:hypothetical protein